MMKNYIEFINESLSSKDLKIYMEEQYSCELDKNDYWSSINIDKNNEIIIDKNSKIIKNKKLVIKFGEISGHFKIDDETLTTLKGCPISVSGQFECSRNNIKNLIGGPKTVKLGYNAIDCGLTSLKGAPKEVYGTSFQLANNKLENLIGLKDTLIERSLILDNNEFLTEVIEFPKVKNIYIGRCGLRTLKGFPKELDNVNVMNNRLKNLEGAPEIIKEDFYISDNPLTSLYGAPKIIHLDSDIRWADDVPELEAIWYTSLNRNGYTDYWDELLTWALKNMPKYINTVNWPKGFLNDNLKKSATTLGKFNL